MKTVYVKAPFQFDFREEPKPVPGPNQVLVDVAYCGICGSDLTMARRTAKDWVALGHEVSGTVAAVGPGVRTVAPGDAVALDCGNCCGICIECRGGRYRRCTAPSGYYAGKSGFADFLLVDAMNVHKVIGLDLKTASLLEPFTVAMYMFRCLDVDFLDDVLLIGPGPIGLLALSACKARGARSIAVAGRSAGARMVYAASMGAKAFIHTGDLAEFIRKNLANSFDKIIVTGPPDFLPAAVAAARTGAIIAYCGLGDAGNKIVALDWDEIHGKNVSIRPMGEVPRDQPQALDLLRRGAVDSSRFITHTFSRNRLPEAFELIEKQRDDVIKVVIDLKA